MQDIHLMAYVIMPDHVHFVIVPPTRVQVGLFVGEFKRRSAKLILSILRSDKQEILHALRVVRDGESKSVIWQRRCFDRNCRDSDEVLGVIEYCHFNPVSSGLVEHPADWKWSSYGWYSED
jgi:putative transposase